jgi:TonB family protein
MQLARSNCIRVSLAVLFLLSLSAPVRAQKSQIEALADQMAGALSHSKQKSVVVFDFLGPDTMDAVGEKLAVDFSAALAKSAHDFRVEDRSRLLEMLKEKSLVAGNIRDAHTALWLLRQSGPDTAILGTMSNGIGGLRLSVEAYRVSDSDSIVSFETSIPLTEDLKSLVREESDRSGKIDYSGPSCIYCPRAAYSDEASEHKVQGTVVLDLTIDEKGQAKDISVKIPMPYGLTEQAVKAIQEWRLKPATDPDGKPVAVRQEVEVTFELY